MKERKEINDKIVSWIVDKVKREYADDISLVLIYGSYINGSANSRSDVDCYYIPETERGYDMAVDFIVDGVGYDIFPMTWERVEGIADLHESMSPLVGDVQIIYCRDRSDRQRFENIQLRLKRNLQDDGYVREIAAKRCEAASVMCSMMNASDETSEIRKMAGGIIMTLADAAAVYNHDYFHFGLKKQFEDLREHFPDMPEVIVEDYKNVIESVHAADVKEHAMKMFNDVCGYLDITCSPQEAPATEADREDTVDASCLAGLYEEISSTFNKIYVCCENGNYILAFLSAVCLQRELDDAAGAGCPKYDMLGGFKYTELYRLSETVQEIEKDFVRFITQNGGHIKRYDSFEQFEAAAL